ncbi:hypothetical protein AQUCO_00300054v1 [Aquilegia coerulea]|uniref:non-specific serine/threonine protein kinase n=1 Tax=Aquilegia coerulea TaxID=218851 RepID=A0A2G5EX26_AQUCA|nr:hypothetical protein AQUCO_00300054v1 [Aquilegia coerulea]
MKCFHFSNGENNKRGGEDNEDGASTTTTANVSRVSRVSWARSLSVASSSVDLKRSADYESIDYSRDLSDSAVFHEFLSQRRANDLRVFAFSELKSATRGFSRSLMIGEGGFGCVYKGVVKISTDDPHDKMDVAVKQLNRNGLQGHKEWITEVNCLGVVKHPNLVKLVGYCAEDDERGIQRLLVYELMPNKSLEDHLLARVPQPLSWTMRLKIAHDAARGLAYLHEEMDFQVVGTVGYAAPEYVQTGRLTAKSDVWSFGVVLYELITGRRSVDRNLPKNEQKLLEWVKPYVSGSKRIHVIMDPQLEGQYCRVSAQKLVSLANKCLMKQPKSRPKMSEVVEMLGQLISETTLSSDCGVSQSVEEAESGKEKEEGVLDTDSTKQGSSYRRMVFDFKEMISSRNRSVGRLDWRNWAPVVRTW